MVSSAILIDFFEGFAQLEPLNPGTKSIGGASSYNVPFAFRITAALPQLLKAVLGLVKRHEALRSVLQGEA